MFVLLALSLFNQGFTVKAFGAVPFGCSPFCDLPWALLVTLVRSYSVRRACNNFLRPGHKVCPKSWVTYPKPWFTYPKPWFIYPKPWDKLCAGVTPTFSGENVNLFCRDEKVKILVGLNRCPVGHDGCSARLLCIALGALPRAHVGAKRSGHRTAPARVAVGADLCP